MSEYFVLSIASPLNAEFFQFKVDRDVKRKNWKMGVLFAEQQEDDDEQPPTEPIELRTDEDYTGPKFIYPEMSWHPIPIMSRRMVEALRSAGVDTLQSYQTKLVTTFGKSPPPADHYFAVNVVGLVAAADLAKSEINPAIPEKMISMDFHSLAIDPAKARGALMFRLAENISAVLVHASVKARLDQAGLNTLSWCTPEEWAG